MNRRPQHPKLHSQQEHRSIPCFASHSDRQSKERSGVFLSLSVSVKSQLRRTAKLYLEYQEAVTK